MKYLILIAVLTGTPPRETGLPGANGEAPAPRQLAITDGGVLVTNVDLLSTSQAPGNPPRNPLAFNIPQPGGSNAAWTIQCPDAGAWVYPDVTTVGPGTGIKIEAGGAYSSACGKTLRLQQFDGGQYVGCVIALSPLAGATAAQCIVHSLQGTWP